MDDRCIDTGAFQPRCLVHELVFACSPPPAAALQGQPFYSDSSRLVLHPCSGPMRIGPSPGHPDRCDRLSSVLALTHDQDTVLRNKYARMKQSNCHNTFLSPQQPSPSSTKPCRSEPADLCHAMENQDVLDGRYTMPLGLQFHSAVRQRTESRLSGALIPGDEESSEEDRPFLSRFLLQEFTFAHNSNEGYSHNKPGLLRNLLSDQTGFAYEGSRRQSA